MKKEELRKLCLEKRQKMMPEERDILSQRISKLFFQKVFAIDYSNIHIFLPIAKYNEVNTWMIIEELKTKKPPVRIVISKSNMASGQMINYFYDPAHRLVENKWGIPEPETGELCDNLSIDLVLVPLLAFDRRGQRIGYGKGFYDRFLKSCREDALKIGLSFEGPVEQIDDADENDVLLDSVVTPDRVYWFKK